MSALSIKQQLRLLILLTIVLLAVIWGVNRHYQEQAANGHEARTRLANLQALLGMARQYEDVCTSTQRAATISGLLLPWPVLASCCAGATIWAVLVMMT
mgnify:CR=1 FL=1